jgi:hypothetical protein
MNVFVINDGGTLYPRSAARAASRDQES